MALILTREVGQAIEIGSPMGEPTRVRVDAITPKLVRLSIEAPVDVTINRAEVAEQARSRGPRDGQLAQPERLDLVDHLRVQQTWSLTTFGPGPLTDSLLDHIRQECLEVAENPRDTVEWIDIVLLALDGAMRTGVTPSEVAGLLQSKFEVVRRRQYPAIGSTPAGQAVCHIREAEAVR